MNNNESNAANTWASFTIIIGRNGKIKFITNDLADRLGYSINELLGKNAIKKLTVESEHDERRSQLDFLFKQENVVDNFDIIIKNKDNDRLEFRFSILKLPSKSKKTEDIALIGDDLSSSMRVKPEIPSELQQVEQIVANAKELIIIIDSEEKISAVNDSAKSKLGFEIGMAFRDLLDPTDVKHTTSFLSSLSNISSSSNINLVLVHPESRQRYYLAGTVSSIVANGRLENFRLILNDVTERTKTEKAKDLYYSIAHHSIHSKNLNDLYYNIHKELKAVVDCENMYIALKEDMQNEEVLNFPYYLEGEFQEVKTSHRKYSNGITEYTIDSGKPQLFTKKDLERLTKEKKIVINGTLPEIWLGVPLKVKSEIIGAIAIQSYHSKSFYTSRDLKLLDFASSQIAMAINMVHTQEKLKAQTAKLNSIIESGSHLIWTVNSDLELTSFNQNYYNAIAYNYDILPSVKEGAQKTKRSFPQFWQEKYQMALNGEQINFEIKLKDANGNDIWKEIYLNPIYLDGKEIKEVSGIANDITEKKESESALVQSEEKFRNIFESFQDVYFRCDRNGVVNMVSPSVEALTGRKVDEVLTRNISSLIDDRETILPLLRKLVGGKEIKNVEVTVRDSEGTLVECICNLRLITEVNNGEELIEGVVRDVTLLKLTNKELILAKDLAEESLLVKELFLANMSHEIRTPLNGIIGVVDLLEQTKLVKQQTAYLKTIKSSSETLLNILNDILDLSKIEAGKMQLRPAPISLRNLIKKIKSLFASRAASNLIKLQFHISKSIPSVVEADEMRIIQVISNLLANSIKFTSRGGSIDLGFELKSESEDDVTIRVDVRDSGIGIKGEDVEKLFTNFTQLDTSTTKAYGGTGLGLSISKQLVELMGGEIGVSSSPGFGSTFWFSFIAKKSEVKVKDTINEEEIKREFPRIKNLHPRILVVDDNLVNREVAGEILKKSGCKVELASNGVEAVLKAKKNNYDIILMDIQMPEMDGIEANKQIKALNKSHRPKIVAMTAYSMKEDEQRFLEAGLDDYIAKPLRATQLIGKVEEILSGIPSEINKVANPNDGNNIVNQEIISQLKKYGGVDMVVNTLKEFEDEASLQLKECGLAIKNKDYNLVRSHLHTLKGSAGTMGVEKVAAHAARLESELKNEDYSNLSKGLSDLNDSFAEFRENFTNIISQY